MQYPKLNTAILQYKVDINNECNFLLLLLITKYNLGSEAVAYANTLKHKKWAIEISARKQAFGKAVSTLEEGGE